MRAALEKQAMLDPLLSAVFAETNPGPFKFLMQEAGEPCGQPRLPLLPPAEAIQGALRNALSQIRHDAAAA